MTDVTTIHQPVLLRDCVDLVAPALAKPGSIAVDCTLGLAGHSTAFLKASPNARLIGIDRDTEALALATKRMEMEGLADRFTPVHAAFDDFSQVLSDQGVDKVNAVFMDLGLSSLQIDETERGFSYSHDAPLDAYGRDAAPDRRAGARRIFVRRFGAYLPHIRRGAVLQADRTGNRTPA